MSDDSLPLLPLILDDVPRGLRQALAQEGIPCCDRREGAPGGRFVLFDSRGGRRRPPAPGQTPIDIDQFRRGAATDPLRALADEQSARFQWSVGEWRLTEEMARVDKRAVRQELLGRLRAVIERVGGVWIHLSAFPFPCRTAFNFRIDYDQYEERDFDALLSAVAGYEEATSHFVNASAYHGIDRAWARLRGLDVGSHGYRHHVYRTEAENVRNIRRSLEVIAEAGFAPSGFVGPHGRFNRSLAAALAALGVRHSSEFGLAYDELPYFPGEHDVLQIPIHPVCLGLFLDAAGPGADEATKARAAEAAAEYFDRVIQSKFLAGEPIFLYGHPTGRLGRYPHVLRRVFSTIDGLGGVWKTTLSEWARWWRARARVQMSVRQLGDELLVRVEHAPASYPFGLEYWRGQHVALLPLDQPELRFSPGGIAYENRPPHDAIRPVRMRQPASLRARVRRWVDWELETPTEEIAADSLRNWTKRALRRHWH